MSMSDHIKDREYAKFFEAFFGTTLRVGATGGVETIDKMHQSVHRGDFFSGGQVFTGVSDNASRFIMLRSELGANVHCVFSTVTRGDAISYIYEAPTITSDGTPLNLTNHNRKNIKPPEALAFHTPTIAAKGDQMNGAQLVSGGRGNQATGASDQIFDNELILKEGVNYLFEVENKAGNNAVMGLYISYYIERTVPSDFF
jgi:hypothetical protein